MRSIESISSTMAPLDLGDVDTDQIIPAIWMKRIERTGFEKGLFQQWRRDPQFVLNRPERQDAKILVAGANFGCGSSREHAPWALRDYGFQAVIAPSFADIFKTNLPNVGLVPVTLAPKQHRRLMQIAENDPQAVLEIDLKSGHLACATHGFASVFSIQQTARYQLLHGKDPVDLTLEAEALIASHEATRPAWMPTGTGLVERPFTESGVKESW